MCEHRRQGLLQGHREVQSVGRPDTTQQNWPTHSTGDNAAACSSVAGSGRLGAPRAYVQRMVTSRFSSLVEPRRRHVVFTALGAALLAVLVHGSGASRVRDGSSALAAELGRRGIATRA